MLKIYDGFEVPWFGEIDSTIPKDRMASARNTGDYLVVEASGPELGRCNMILTHDRHNLYSLAGNIEATFIGEDARKIVLNWQST